jgi:hypothetical protein
VLVVILTALWLNAFVLPAPEVASAQFTMTDQRPTRSQFAQTAGGLPENWTASVNLTGTDTVPLLANGAKYVLTANETLTIQQGSVAASLTRRSRFAMQICQNATGNFTLSFAAGKGISNINWSGGMQPGYTLTANSGDFYECLYDGSNLDCRETISNVPC